MKIKAALYILAMLVGSPVFAGSDNRVKQATAVVLQLCIAGGVESIEVTKQGDSIHVTGEKDSLQIDRRESSGLVGGISKEITALSAQQASEARSCTQKYLKELVDIILQDESVQEGARPKVSGNGSIFTDPEAFWGGSGIWEDNQNYCEALQEFLSAAGTPSNFRYSDNGEFVSLDTVPSTTKPIEGNYFVKTEAGSTAQFCGVYYNSPQSYNAIVCDRAVSQHRPDVFASVYNQTLKDMRDCLLPAGWTQTSLDQGACLPKGIKKGECIRRFKKGTRTVWLFSNLEADLRYTVGVQTYLGPPPQ